MSEGRAQSEVQHQSRYAGESPDQAAARVLGGAGRGALTTPGHPWPDPGLLAHGRDECGTLLLLIDPRHDSPWRHVGRAPVEVCLGIHEDAPVADVRVRMTTLTMRGVVREAAPLMRHRLLTGESGPANLSVPLRDWPDSIVLAFEPHHIEIECAGMRHTLTPGAVRLAEPDPVGADQFAATQAVLAHCGDALAALVASILTRSPIDVAAIPRGLEVVPVAVDRWGLTVLVSKDTCRHTFRVTLPRQARDVPDLLGILDELIVCARSGCCPYREPGPA